MPSLVDQSFCRNLLVMKIVGLYPYDGYPEIYKVYAYSLYFLCTVSVPLLATADLIVARERDLAKISDSLFVILEVGICILKFLPFKNRQVEIRRTIFALDSTDFDRSTRDQGHIVEAAVRSCRRMFVVFMVLCLGSLFTWPIKVLFYERRKFPIDVWLPFEPFEDLRVYLGVFLYIFIATGNAPIGNAAVDTLIAGLIYHAATQIKIIKDKLEKLGQRVEKDISERYGDITPAEKDTIRNTLVYRSICENIEHYDRIYQFVDELQNTFGLVILSQFIVSIIVICMSCLQLSIVEPLTPIFFAMIIYIVSLLIEVFFYCYYGTILYEESNSVVHAIYMSEWYEYDEKSKRALITLMERAKRPMIMTTAKLVDLSLHSWTLIIRRSYSLLAVLKNYN